MPFKPGDAVIYNSKFGSDVDGMKAHIINGPFPWKDDDGDGPRSEPYDVYRIQSQGGRGFGGFWAAENTLPDPDPQPPVWPID